MRKRISLLWLPVMLVMLLVAWPIGASQTSETMTGFMGDDVPNFSRTYTLNAGQAIEATSEATSGNLDTVLLLLDEDGNTVAENDDRAFGDLDSHLNYTISRDGTYSLILTNIIGTSGNYRLTVTISNPSGDTSSQAANDTPTQKTFSGFVSNRTQPGQHTIQLEQGQGITVIAEVMDGDLDTVLSIYNPQDQVATFNDDRALDDLNSEVTYIAQQSGQYTLVVENYGNTGGDYRLTLEFVSAGEAETRLRGSYPGGGETLDTQHFRIHYTHSGEDAVTDAFLQAVAATAEQVYSVQIIQEGWPEPPADGTRGGDARYDIYLRNTIDAYYGNELGMTVSEFPMGDNPNTPMTENRAIPSFITMDNDYDLGLSGEEPLNLMRATLAHEFHHAIQFGLQGLEGLSWYYEGTAAWMETVTLSSEAQDATRYVNSAFDYPEICLGAIGQADPTEGNLQYSTWLFLQSLVDRHGDDIVRELWQEIARTDGWEPLERVLAARNETVAQAVTYYHLKNLVRDYNLAPAFDDASVWREAKVGSFSPWQASEGVQELGANYLELTLQPGLYRFNLNAARPGLSLWLVGISGNTAEAVNLGQGATADTTSYEQPYLVVINTNYDANLAACEFVPYSLAIAASNALPVDPTLQLDSSQFVPIR